MRERLPSAVLDDEASEVIFNDPRWWEATRGGHEQLSNDPIKIKRPADNDSADERPNKRAEPSISRLVGDNDAEPSTSYSRN